MSQSGATHVPGAAFIASVKNVQRCTGFDLMEFRGRYLLPESVTLQSSGSLTVWSETIEEQPGSLFVRNFTGTIIGCD